jgi:hypothetical protein
MKTETLLIIGGVAVFMYLAMKSQNTSPSNSPALSSGPFYPIQDAAVTSKSSQFQQNYSNLGSGNARNDVGGPVVSANVGVSPTLSATLQAGIYPTLSVSLGASLSAS